VFRYEFETSEDGKPLDKTGRWTAENISAGIEYKLGFKPEAIRLIRYGE
jgi:hypothetical protein